MGLDKVDDEVKIVKLAWPKEKSTSVQLLHICIPGGLSNFNSEVTNLIDKWSPQLTIIHSTVPIGTTDKIFSEGYLVAHSPVRGKHPKMESGLETYIKYISYPPGYADEDKYKVKKVFSYIGITVKEMSSYKTTEAAKILSTTRYGISLLFAELQDKFLKEIGLDYDEAVYEWEKTYNAGVDMSGLGKYRRPMLTPPDGHIGGHCVVENAKMLMDTCTEARELDYQLFPILLDALSSMKKEDNDGT